MGEKKGGVMDGTQVFDSITWGIAVPVTEMGKLQEEQHEEMNSVLNMSSLLSWVCAIPKERCREGFGCAHLELSGARSGLEIHILLSST